MEDTPNTDIDESQVSSEPAAATANADAPAPRKDYGFEFTGQSGEYFRIWIVNILLTIATLGIYSAWAKVRNERYFHGNTFLDGSSFEYTADPIRILRGRIIAVVVLVLYQALGFLSTTLSLALAAALLLATPALIVMAMRFRMRYVSWRNISFGFEPNFKKAYLLFSPALLMLGLAIGGSVYVQNSVEDQLGTADDPQAVITMQRLNDTAATNADEQYSEGSYEAYEDDGYTGDDYSYDEEYQDEPELNPEAAEKAGYAAVGFLAILFLLYLLFPLWQKLYYSFLANNSGYGRSRFAHVATVSEYYGMYIIAALLAAAVFVLAMVIVMLAGVVAGAAGIDVEGSVVGIILGGIGMAIFIIAMMVPQAYVQTQMANIIYGNLELDGITFRSELKVPKMTWLYATNTIGILLSLGMLIPWAKIRMARYRAETMTLFASDFDGFQARAAGDIGAQGSEISDFMDIDLGL